MSEEELEMAKENSCEKRDLLIRMVTKQRVQGSCVKNLWRRNGHLCSEEAEALVQEKFDWTMKRSRKNEEKARKKLEKEAREKNTSVDALALKKLEKEAKKSGTSVNHLVRQMLLQGVKGMAPAKLSEYEKSKKLDGTFKKLLASRTRHVRFGTPQYKKIEKSLLLEKEQGKRKLSKEKSMKKAARRNSS